MSTVLLTRITLGEITLRSLLTGLPVVLPGAILTDAAALAFCAANAIDLKGANLSGCDFNGADISGLWAPNSDMRNCTFRNAVANRAVGGRICEVSASMLQGSIITGTLTHANLACCGAPLGFRVTPGPQLRVRGIDWSSCPDVLLLPVRDDRVGRVIAVSNSVSWRVHAGERGVLTEAEARTQLAQNADTALAARYSPSLTWLEGTDGVAAKATIDGRAAGTGTVIRPIVGGA
jgi:uncharacterized protein YjbI with pentapeptide repeats